MNILQIISGQGVNGALVYCKILSEELAARGHNVTLICKPRSWISKNINADAVTVHESTMAKYPFGEFKKYSQIIRQQNIQLIHSHMTGGQNFGIGLKMITGVPVVATAHNRHFELHWNFNDYVIANSQATFEFHSKFNWVPAKRMETIYCYTDLDHFNAVSAAQGTAVRTKLNLKPDDFLIGVFGEVVTRKGHCHLVRAMPQIIQQIPGAQVAFVGLAKREAATVKQVRKQILDLQLFGRIKWAGRHDNVADYMKACQVVVVPSVEEPLGLVAMEGIMAGTPVVASDTGGLGEIIIHEETGLLVPSCNDTELAKAIVRLANEPELGQRLVAQGLRHVREHFSVQPLTDKVESVYERVATASRVKKAA